MTATPRRSAALDAELSRLEAKVAGHLADMGVKS